MRFCLRLSASFEMYFDLDEFKDKQERMQLWILGFVGWLRWLLASLQDRFEVIETVTHSVILQADLGMTCVGNLAVFAVILF